MRRGRSPEVLRLLAEHGAELDRPGGETWRGEVPLRTPYQQAVLRGRVDQAEALAELGASTEVSPDDIAVAAVAAGSDRRRRFPTPRPGRSGGRDPRRARRPLSCPSTSWARTSAASSEARPRGRCSTTPPGSATPGSCGELLARGADAGARSSADLETPLAWAAHGSQYELPGRDYVAVAELLVDAGNDVEPRLLEVAEGPLYDWLAERLEPR